MGVLLMHISTEEVAFAVKIQNAVKYANFSIIFLLFVKKLLFLQRVL